MGPIWNKCYHTMTKSGYKKRRMLRKSQYVGQSMMTAADEVDRSAFPRCIGTTSSLGVDGLGLTLIGFYAWVTRSRFPIFKTTRYWRQGVDYPPSSTSI
jgi:hypothetical protein